MAYTPINWQTGDTITAEKMNKMDNGWGVESTQLFSESVTTIDDGGIAWGEFAYNTQITADSVVVTFNGTDYNVSGTSEDGAMVYGDITFTGYPFFIVSSIDANEIATQSAGTYAVAISSESVAISDSFNSAVNQCVDTSTLPMLCVSGVTTNAEMATAFGHGSLLFFRPYPSIRASYIITRFDNEEARFIPEDPGVSATFENDVFTVTLHT